MSRCQKTISFSEVLYHIAFWPLFKAEFVSTPFNYLHSLYLYLRMKATRGVYVLKTTPKHWRRDSNPRAPEWQSGEITNFSTPVKYVFMGLGRLLPSQPRTEASPRVFFLRVCGIHTRFQAFSLISYFASFIPISTKPHIGSWHYCATKPPVVVY